MGWEGFVGKGMVWEGFVGKGMVCWEGHGLLGREGNGKGWKGWDLIGRYGMERKECLSSFKSKMNIFVILRMSISMSLAKHAGHSKRLQYEFALCLNHFFG